MFNRLCLLFSYHYIRASRAFEEAVLALAPYCDVLIDSGAFSDHYGGLAAAKQGRKHNPINIDEYIEACRRYHGKVWQYIMLDVIKNPGASRANLERMTDAGLRPMPVFVYPESYDRIPHMVEVNEHICVPGGASKTTRRFMWQRFQRAYEASDRKARIHGLGFVRWPDMFHLPLYSVDSSSWSTGGRFGSIVKFGGEGGMISFADSKNVHKPEQRKYLLDNGVTVDQLYDPIWMRRHNGIPTLFTVFAYLQAQHYCRPRRPHLFLAVVNLSWLVNLIACIAAGTPGHFDYRTACGVRERLNSLSKTPDRQADMMIDVLKGRTKWEVLE